MTAGETSAQRAWQQRNARLAGLEQWEVRGRLSLRLPQEAVNASFEWRQALQAYNLDLSGPLGQGQVKLSAAPGLVTLTTAQGERWSAQSPEALLKERLNWDLPVAGLSYWLLGRSDPAREVETLEVDELGRPTRLGQDGWEVTYQQYITYQGVDVPTKLSLKRPGVRAKVLASRWAFDPL